MIRRHRGTAGGVAALLLAGLLAACATAPDGGRSAASLPEILDDARQHPQNRPANVAACESWVADNSGGFPQGFPYAAFFAGLFDVPQAAGGQAFCAALIEAAIAGDFSRRDQDAFRLPQEVRGRKPVGALLRALMVAHERLYAQQAQKPPQAQSCGCGQ